jgi:hypothetical protein
LTESNCEPTAGKREHKISPAVKLTLANFGKVPKAASHDLGERPFVVTTR